MNSKIRREIIAAYSTVDTVAMLVISLIAIWFNIWAGIVGLVLTAGLWFYHKYVTEKKISKKLAQYKEIIIKDRDDMMQAFSNGAPLLVCVLDKNQRLQWSNPAFDEVFDSKESFAQIKNEHYLDELYLSENAETEFSFKDHIFNVTSTYMGSNGLRMFFWRNVTSRENFKAMLEDSRACLAIIDVDNYDELLQSEAVENRSSLAASIDSKIYEWAKSLEAAIFQISDNRYSMFFQNKYLKDLRDNGFKILDEMHEIETAADFPTSISVGIGYGEDTLEALQSTASEAFELALGRGGDQAVVRQRGGDTEYYGGTLPAVEKRNKGKSRVMAHALANLIQDADKVFIVGHARPDMDAFGSAIGIYALTTNIGKPAYIVLESNTDAIDLIYEQSKNQGPYSFITHDEARTMLSSKTLIVMVDHHRAAISDDPALLTMTKKIAIIDHHRRMADAIEKPVLFHMEVSASSASELVSEMLQYSGDRGEISHFEAEALLAGIMLDSKNFTTNAGVRTFDAASWLKRKGADTNNVKNYFKIDLDFYQKKLNVIANAEILQNGIAVAYTKETDPAMGLIVSQAADELLTMQGVDAAIAAGSNGETTMVSARSNGSKYNVQTLMEKLGGGGHQNAAAVQLEVGAEEAISQVVQAMRIEGML